MKGNLRVGFLSVALAQNLLAVNATAWWQLNMVNNPPQPPPNPIVINDPLTIYEPSTLSITTTNNPTIGNQLFNGSIVFNHNLNINLNVNQVKPMDMYSTIYEVKNGANKIFSGAGSLGLTINAPNQAAKSVFNVEGGKLSIHTNTTIKTTQDSNLYSVFQLKGAGSTLTFTRDFIVDLSNSKANLKGQGGQPDMRAIFDIASGTLNINPNASSNVTVQLKGDFLLSGSTATLKLSNAQSFIIGKIRAQNGGNNTLSFSNGASSDLDVTLQNNGNLTINANNGSSVKLKVNFLQNNPGTLNLIVQRSSLYADFKYTPAANPPNPPQNLGSITISNAGTWYLGSENRINTLMINNASSQVTPDNLKKLTNLSAVDMRYQNQGGSLRDQMKFTATDRYTLTTKQIQGSDGIFRIFGVLNRDGWTTTNNQVQYATEATDQIVTESVFNTHYIQVFWNANNFDKSLLNKDLEADKIVVAKQTANNGNGNFIGAVTPIGLYNYVTNLKKETIMGGFQWIIKDVQRADNSYLSRLLDSLFQSQYRIFKMEYDTLNLRLGELRDMKRVHGVWLRTKYGRLKSKASDQTTGSWDEFTSIWAGYDRNFYVLGGKNFLGFALNTTAFRNHGISDGNDKSGESYYASSRTYGVSVYDTYFFDNGWYIDGILKYYLTYNDLSIQSEVLEGSYPKFFTHGILASLETGRKFRLPIFTPDPRNSFYYLKPEAQMILGFVSGIDQNLQDWSNQNILARLDYNIPAVFRVGLMFGREFNQPNIKGDVYLGTSFEYDINTGGELRLEDFLDKMTLTHRGNFNMRFNAGTNLILNEYWRIYFDIDTSFFGRINSTFTINGGVRINFGRLHPSMPYIPQGPGLRNDFSRKDRRTIPEVQNYETRGILDNYNGNKRGFKPPVKIDQKPFKTIQPAQNLNIRVKPTESKNAPVFIDNPPAITPPQKNYTRDKNPPILPQGDPRNTRDMRKVIDQFNEGYK